MARVQTTAEPMSERYDLSPRSRVIFVLDDGSELSVSLNGDGTSITIRNLGTRLPSALQLIPEASNSIRVGVQE